MIQEFINRHFFNLYIFTLIFGHIFYGTIGFDYTDEICALVLLILYGYYILKTPTWDVNKHFVVVIGIFLFYLFYSLYIKSNTNVAIISDLIIQFKPYLAFFCVFSILPLFSTNRKKVLRWIAVGCWFIQLALAIVEIFVPFTLSSVMGHATYFAAGVIATSLCFLYTGDFSTKDKLIFLIMLSIGLISGRSKFYGFYALAVFVILFFSNVQQFKLNTKNVLIILCMLIAILFVAREKIYFYFYQTLTSEVDRDMIARYVLYATAPDVLRDYFPFGSGFATYGTFSSGEYYSHIYVQYGIDTVWGMSKDFYNYVADTYYPSLAQFGVVGIFLYILFWIFILKKAFEYNQQLKQSKLLIIILLIVSYFAIEGTTDSTFTTHRGIYMMMTLGLMLAEMKQNVKQNTKQIYNEDLANK